ncbi:hypothetical protein [uncultured Microscilla sp.]|uniref:hypothetical protein n=1 Tax=uncultured Microscilla sp. TaxID=432653 RepID=UPI00263789C0|nr:hypothetical protein [uncultured Microscilla sp.]
MKGWIIHVPWMKPAGMALFPFILVRERRFEFDPVLLNHERIHFRQQVEMLIIPFYLLYIVNYTVNYIKYGMHYEAYRQMYYEREAYANEKDMNYLKKRKFWAFLGYIKK